MPKRVLVPPGPSERRTSGNSGRSTRAAYIFEREEIFPTKGGGSLKIGASRGELVQSSQAPEVRVMGGESELPLASSGRRAAAQPRSRSRRVSLRSGPTSRCRASWSASGPRQGSPYFAILLAMLEENPC